jgi:hypothetical protein
MIDEEKDDDEKGEKEEEEEEPKMCIRRHFEKESMPREAAQQKGQSMASGENPLRVVVSAYRTSDRDSFFFFPTHLAGPSFSYANKPGASVRS